jgi:hypothetical protein
MLTPINLSSYKENTIDCFGIMEYHYCYCYLLTLHTKHCHSDVFILLNVITGDKCCPFLIQAVGTLVPTQNSRNSTILCCSSRHYHSAQRVTKLN